MFGKEGSHAATFADISVVDFKSLRKLVFYHGRSFALKLTNFLKISCERNFLGGFPMFIFAFYNLSMYKFADEIIFLANAILFINGPLLFYLLFD